jgi:hypothetical protein
LKPGDPNFGVQKGWVTKPGAVSSCKLLRLETAFKSCTAARECQP